MRECKECGGDLEIMGTSYHGGIEVECKDCGEFYEVESDGLGEAGEEYIDALMVDLWNAPSGRFQEE
jgi:hypothetical protein